jgi:hypothetical protein
VRLSVKALSTSDGLAADSIVVVLNRYDEHNDVHVRNQLWLIERNGIRVIALPGEESTLVALVRGG